MSYSQNNGNSDRAADAYEQLPDCVRQYYSRHEYLWLSDDQKARLIEQECEPEWT